MRPPNTDWTAVARAKLTTVLGEGAAEKLMGEILVELRSKEVTSPVELRRFAELLSARGGIPAAIAGMLRLHATLYGGNEERKAPSVKNA